MRTNGSSLRHDPVSTSQARRAFAANPLAALIATGFGSGLSPFAPGTAGSLVGLLLAWILASRVPILGSWVGLLMSGLAVGILGVFVSPPVCRALESEDPGCVVIDEVAGQLLAASGAVAAGGPGWGWGAAFALFRDLGVFKTVGM